MTHTVKINFSNVILSCIQFQYFLLQKVTFHSMRCYFFVINCEMYYRYLCENCQQILHHFYFQCTFAFSENARVTGLWSVVLLSPGLMNNSLPSVNGSQQQTILESLHPHIRQSTRTWSMWAVFSLGRLKCFIMHVWCESRSDFLIHNHFKFLQRSHKMLYGHLFW